MWVGWIRRCLRRSSTCDGSVSGVRGGVASWYSAYHRDLFVFLVVDVLAVSWFGLLRGSWFIF